MIANKLEIEYKQLIRYLENIQNEIIESGLVKKCKDGSIIIMEDV